MPSSTPRPDDQLDSGAPSPTTPAVEPVGGATPEATGGLGATPTDHGSGSTPGTMAPPTDTKRRRRKPTRTLGIITAAAFTLALLTGLAAVLTWVQIYRTLEAEPRASISHELKYDLREGETRRAWVRNPGSEGDC